jgi:hypothetical protein
MSPCGFPWPPRVGRWTHSIAETLIHVRWIGYRSWWLTLSVVWISAPLVRRSAHVSLWPCLAAKSRAVDPFYYRISTKSRNALHNSNIPHLSYLVRVLHLSSSANEERACLCMASLSCKVQRSRFLLLQLTSRADAQIKCHTETSNTGRLKIMEWIAR